MKKRSPIFKTAIILIPILLIIAAAYGIYVVTKTQTPPLTKTYTNSYYKFSINLPKDTEYCINDCYADDFEDKDSTNFEINGNQLAKIDNTEFGKGSDLAYIQIKFDKNKLGMSAIDFAKRSLEANKKYSKKDIYSKEEETTFAGEKAYSFVAEHGFEERGKIYNLSGVTELTNNLSQAGEGRVLSVPHRVIYFDHEGYIYRILYPLNTNLAKEIIDSFKFTK